MKTLRQLKLNEYKENKITLNELKEVLVRWYYGHVYKTRPDLFESDMERELIITEINGSYGQTSSVVFSVNGSPPKGEAILFLQGMGEGEYWMGCLVCMGNGKVSNRVHTVKIKKEIKKDGRTNRTPS